MPALTLFGRKWMIGTDDFVLPGLLDLIVTVIWIVSSVLVYWASDHSTWECAGKEKISTYLYGVLSILSLIAINATVLIHNSKAGCITDTQARHLVPYCLYTRLFLLLLSVVWNGLGSTWILNGSLDCSASLLVIRFIKGYLICNWIFGFFTAIAVTLVFDPHSKKDIQRNREEALNYNGGTTKNFALLSELPDSAQNRIWTRRLRFWFLNWFIRSSNREGAFTEAGKILGIIFANTDLVPTDAIAGLLLLRLRNENANKSEGILLGRSLRLNPELEKLPPVTMQPGQLVSTEKLFQEDWRNPILLSHFLNFARAAYAWPLVLCDKKRNAIPRLCRNAVCCSCIPRRNRNEEEPLAVVGDDCCFCHTSGVRCILNDPAPNTLIHLCFTNKVFKSPFFIAKDPLTKSIVISIRGTMSNADLVTDMAGWPAPIDFPGLPASFKGHHGMVVCAKELKKELDTLQIIPKLLQENPGYSLVLTGTSLGAGAGSILGLMLKDKYPHLKCYAFSPPGGLLSMDAAECCNEFTTSVIYGNDLIPRLSILSIEKLKYSVIQALKQSTTPKYQIILGALWRRKKRKRKLQKPEKTLSKSESNGHQQQQQGQHQQDQQSQALHIDISKSNFTLDSWTNSNSCIDLTPQTETESCQLVPCEEMYPPGKIVYITETREFSSSHNKGNKSDSGRWRIRWAERTEFDAIIIHDRLMGDHLPYRMYKALEVLAQNKAQIGHSIRNSII